MLYGVDSSNRMQAGLIQITKHQKQFTYHLMQIQNKEQVETQNIGLIHQVSINSLVCVECNYIQRNMESAIRANAVAGMEEALNLLWFRSSHR